MARIQYKGNFYDTNDPQQNAELLRLQKAENIKKAMQSLQPNRQDAPQKKLEAANLLAQNQALLNARTGVPPVSPNTYNVLSQNNGLLEVAPPNTNIDERAARVRSLLDSQQVSNNNTASNQVNQPSTQPAQPQPKRTLGQRASGLFDRVSDAYMGAAPIFAVAQEFQKAGALRPIGSPMQGDPYGKMMQIQQGRQQAENLTNLRKDKRYEKFANLPDEQFLQAINEQIKFDIENKLNVTPDQTIQTSRENAVVSEETEEALGRAKSAFGITDTFREKLGAVGEYVPFRERTFAPKTQAARQAVRMNVTKTKQFFLTDFAGRVAKYTAETINNILPMRFDAGSSQMTGFKSESFATNSYQNLKSEVERIVSVAESTLQNPNTTNKEKSDARSALSTGNQLIKEYDIILESLSGEREGTNENAGTIKRFYDVTQFDNKEPIENVRERFYTGGGLQIVAESRGLK
jgi:hypothetical protein